jgi:hypothetical protein
MTGAQDSRYRRGRLAGSREGADLGVGVFDHQPRRESEATESAGRTRLVVSVLLRHAAGGRRLPRNVHDFNKLIWHEASPAWKFDDATYDRTAAAFGNPDHVDIVIHNYRWRLGLAAD